MSGHSASGSHAPIFLRQTQLPCPVPTLNPIIQRAPVEQPVAQSISPDEVFVIPQPDPTRQISMPDEEDDPALDLTEDGVADDPDDFAPGPGDGELEDDSSDLPIGRCPPPPYVMDGFRVQSELIKSLNNMTKGTNFYSERSSFWLPRKDTFFFFQSPAVSPTLLYNPRFFYWDPLLLVDHIPCPMSGCSGHLIHHAYTKRPRGVIDLEDRFWLIGYRYRCNACRPVKTFQSWHPDVMAKLPRSLVAEFPAHLSHRSGMSTGLFAFMRCCFQNGMGARQFSDAINVMHRRKYEMLEVQYIRIIHKRSSAAQWMDKTFPPFPQFTDRGPHGLHAIIPSARWYRNMYDKFMESHEKEFDQHTALLSCHGCAIDHSFKVCAIMF